ncbi:MAG TPA: polysaccharide pyruvyl transferase family protein [Chthoniobacterales bacterium]
MSKKRYLFWGANSAVTEKHRLTNEKFAAVGYNFGNMMIGYSVREIVQHHPESRFLNTVKDDPEDLHREFDGIIVPASNFINSYADYSAEAEFFRKVRLPVVVIGLGSQAALHHVGPLPLHAGTERFIRVLAEKSVSLGVRGAFTMELLAKLNIHNAVPIGCASYYLRPKAISMLGSRRPPPRETFAFVFNSDPTIYEVRALRPQLRRFHSWGAANGGSFVPQNEKFMWDSAAQTFDTPGELTLPTICKYFCLPDTDAALRFFQEKSHVFECIPDWIKFMQSKHFCIGPRFHGGIVALQSGVPTQFMVHDRRTQELVECLGLPWFTLDQWSESSSPFEVCRKTDYRPTLRKFPQLLQRFLDFLHSNHLETDETYLQDAESVVRNSAAANGSAHALQRSWNFLRQLFATNAAVVLAAILAGLK